MMAWVLLPSQFPVNPSIKCRFEIFIVKARSGTKNNHPNCSFPHILRPKVWVVTHIRERRKKMCASVCPSQGSANAGIASTRKRNSSVTRPFSMLRAQIDERTHGPSLFSHHHSLTQSARHDYAGARELWGGGGRPRLAERERAPNAKIDKRKKRMIIYMGATSSGLVDDVGRGAQQQQRAVGGARRLDSCKTTCAPAPTHPLLPLWVNRGMGIQFHVILVGFTSDCLHCSRAITRTHSWFSVW